MFTADRLKNLAGILSEEKSRYEDSSDFTEEMGDVSKMINDLHKIITSKRWGDWCKVTDENYSTSTINKNEALKRQVKGLKEVFKMFEDEMDSAA